MNRDLQEAFRRVAEAGEQNGQGNGYRRAPVIPASVPELPDLSEIRRDLQRTLERLGRSCGGEPWQIN
jgi:hypothetical protein